MKANVVCKIEKNVFGKYMNLNLKYTFSLLLFVVF
jgi:hypothetical protein